LTINLFVILILFQFNLELRDYVRLCSAHSLNVCWNIIFKFKNLIEHQHSFDWICYRFNLFFFK